MFYVFNSMQSTRFSNSCWKVLNLTTKPTLGKGASLSKPLHLSTNFHLAKNTSHCNIFRVVFTLKALIWVLPAVKA